jgi:hypothetical protein
MIFQNWILMTQRVGIRIAMIHSEQLAEIFYYLEVRLATS